MTAKHHPLSASTSERWLNCSGSVELIKHAPASAFNSTVESAEGTLLHQLTEEQLKGWLKTGKIVEQAIGSKYTVDGFEFSFNEEHREAIRISIGYVLKLIEDHHVKPEWVRLETRVTIPTNWENYFPEDGPLAGILDLQIIAVMNCMYIIDHKYGKGVKVSVLDNKQLLYYALGAWLALSAETREMIDEIRLVVNQPRHFSGASVDVWTIDADKLMGFHEELLNGTQRIIDKDFTLVAGSWCRWCPAKLLCDAYKDYSVQIDGSAATDFKALTVVKELPVPSEMSNEQLGAILSRRKMFFDFMEAIEKETFTRITDGQKIPGIGLKPKRSNREYFDAESVISYFERNDFEREFFMRESLLPITELEKKIKVLEKESGPLVDFELKGLAGLDEAPPFSLNDYIHKPDNGQTLAVTGE